MQALSSSATLWLGVTLLLIISPHLVRQPAWGTLICLAILAWRYAREKRSWALPAKWLRALITFSLVGATLIHYRTLNGLDAGTTLLTLMICLKLIELRYLRDAMTTLMMGYFLVLSGFLYDQSIFSGLYLIFMVVILTAALLVLQQSAPALPQSKQIKYHLKTSATLLVQAIPLMLILFLLVPRIPGPLWSLPSPSSGKTGLSDSMTIGNITHLADSDEVAFRASFDGPLPEAQQLYWRGPVFWKTDGRSWYDLGKNHPLLRTQQHSYRQLTQPIEYSVTLEANDRNWLFALDLPALIPDGATLRPDYQLLSKEPISSVYRYTMRSTLNYRNDLAPPIERSLALQLPPGVNPRTQALAEKWRQQYPSDLQLVNAALEYFRQQPFYYSRQPPALNGDSPIDQFLFDSRKGFCEHYSAAFVTLMRAANIPARVVTGYQGGEYNALGDYLIVRQSDAHAWAEVWVDDQGWLRADPTNVIPPQRIESFADTLRFRATDSEKLLSPSSDWLQRSWLQARRGWDAMNHQWNQWFLGFDQEKQKQLLEALGLGKFDYLKVTILMFLLIIGLLAALTILLLYRRQQASEPLLRAYQQLCDKLTRRGVDCAPHLGPQQRCRLAIAQLPKQRHEIRQLFRDYIRLRYREQNDPQQLQQFIGAVKRFRC